LRRSGLRVDARSIFRPDFELWERAKLKLRPSGFDQGAYRNAVLGALPNAPTVEVETASQSDE